MARHRLLVDSLAQAFWETDPQGLITTDSPSWRKTTGQTTEEWLGEGWAAAVHPDDRNYALRQWREAVAANRNVDAEFRLRSAQGGWRWTNKVLEPVLLGACSNTSWVAVQRSTFARTVCTWRLHFCLAARKRLRRS